MFGKPAFPIPINEKVTLEIYLDWLFRHFGAEPIFECETLEPDSAEVRHCVSKAGVVDKSKVLQLVDARFPFDSLNVELIDWDGDAVVPFDPGVFLVDPELQCNVAALISGLSCRLSTQYLASLNETDEYSQLEVSLLGELCPVWFGLGIFCANVSLGSWQYSHGEQHWWDHQKFTHFAARQFGVALAYREWGKQQAVPKWSRTLRPDARAPFRKALKYLKHTNDSVFDPVGITDEPKSEAAIFICQDVGQLISQLDIASDSKTFAILSRLNTIADGNSFEVNQQSLSCLFPRMPMWLAHKDSSIRSVACNFLYRFGTVDEPILECLKDLLSDPDDELRKEAASAIVFLSPSGQLVPSDLYSLLRSLDPGVTQAALQGLIFLQQKDEDLVQLLLPIIRKSVNAESGSVSEYAIGALDTISEHAVQHLQQYFDYEPDSVELVLQCLQDWRQKRDDVQESELGEAP